MAGAAQSGERPGSSDATRARRDVLAGQRAPTSGVPGYEGAQRRVTDLANVCLCCMCVDTSFEICGHLPIFIGITTSKVETQASRRAPRHVAPPHTGSGRQAAASFAHRRQSGRCAHLALRRAPPPHPHTSARGCGRPPSPCGRSRALSGRAAAPRRRHAASAERNPAVSRGVASRDLRRASRRSAWRRKLSSLEAPRSSCCPA